MNKTIIGLIIAALFGSGGLVASHYTLQAKSEMVAEDVKDNTAKIEKAGEEVVERRIVDSEQSIHIQKMQQNQLDFIKAFEKLHDKLAQ